jgi:16S rRNA (adenine1518-N6/adenine1519-N6)-dimethyltransferase
VRHQRSTPSGPIRRALASIGRRPRKRLGQHFLADAGVAQRIVDLAQLHGSETVVEIGPGLGALSDRLLPRVAALWLIEVDADLAAHLQAKYADQPHVHVVCSDVLGVDFVELLGAPMPAVVVANLPYNIATAVLAHLLEQHRSFSRLVLMLQREVAERLRADPGSKDYGALTVFTQFAARVRSGLRVSPHAFVPAPKVDSEVIIVEPYAQPPVEVRDPALLKRVVGTVFNQRRKQLANSLRPICADPVGALRAAHIDPTRRPETLSLAEFAALSNVLKERRQTPDS